MNRQTANLDPRARYTVAPSCQRGLWILTNPRGDIVETSDQAAWLIEQAERCHVEEQLTAPVLIDTRDRPAVSAINLTVCNTAD